MTSDDITSGCQLLSNMIWRHGPTPVSFSRTKNNTSSSSVHVTAARLGSPRPRLNTPHMFPRFAGQANGTTRREKKKKSEHFQPNLFWMDSKTPGSPTSRTLSLRHCISLARGFIQTVRALPSTSCESLHLLPVGPRPDASFHFPLEE